MFCNKNKKSRTDHVALKAYIARLITPLSYKLYIGLVVNLIKHDTNLDINSRLPSGKSLDKLLSWPQPATVC